MTIVRLLTPGFNVYAEKASFDPRHHPHAELTAVRTNQSVCMLIDKGLSGLAIMIRRGDGPQIVLTA